MKYRKKPVVVEAIQFVGFNTVEIAEFMGRSLNEITVAPFVVVLSVDTLEGRMTAQKGDWIIKGVKGEFYPCKSDIFEQTYDATS